MRVKGGFWVAVFFLALGVFGIVQSLTFGYGESLVLPLGISAIITVLAAVEIVRELRRRGDKGEAAPEKEAGGGAGEKADPRRLGVVLGWAAGFCLAVFLLGFYIAIPAFALAYLKWRRRSWLTAAIFAAAITAFSYAVFDIGLNAGLYRGLVFGGWG